MEKNIIKVIIFFDLFDYPLTLQELWHYLDKKISLEDIYDYLKAATTMIESQAGFYFLLGRQEIIAIRQKRYNYTNHKIKIAQKFVQIFRLLPFVKAVILVNSIGSHNLRFAGDIDLFIITARKRIWLSRFFCAGFAKILNSRPTVNNKRNKICLSFYISEDHYNLTDLMLRPEDPYFHYWFRDLLLLYSAGQTYNNFLIANNLLAGEVKVEIKNKNILFNFLEELVKKWQLKIMPLELKTKINNSTGVVINDSVLKLYLRDRRQEFLKKYYDKIHEIFKENN